MCDTTTVCDGYVTFRFPTRPARPPGHQRFASIKVVPTVPTPCSIIPSPSISGRTLRISSNVAKTLVALLAPALCSRDAEQRVAHYSPKHRLAFSLLNTDAATGRAILGLEIANAIHRTFASLCQNLLYPSPDQGTSRPSSTSSCCCTTLQSKAKSSSTPRSVSNPANCRTDPLVSQE